MTKTKNKRARRKNSRGNRVISAGIPSREKILKFISDNPETTGKHDIAREFRISGASRIMLKDILNELCNDGLLERRGKKLRLIGTPPRVAVLDIIKRNHDGVLTGVPSQWENRQIARPTILIQSQTGRGEKAGVGSRVLAKISPDKSKNASRSAKIIRILTHQENNVLGILRQNGDHFRLEPVNRKQSKIDINTELSGGGKNGDLVEVQVGRNRKYGLKHGKVIKIIGPFTDSTPLSTIAIHENSIPHIFPQSVLKEANSAKPVSTKSTKQEHEDWRTLPFITIDPDDARDHDDAIYAHARDEGGYIIHVAIADVSWYVLSGSSLDQEALKRGNSVYFPDRVVPMLPERISNNLCSLKENTDRPAIAVRMTFESGGRKLSHSFHRVLIRSKARLSYVQAQAAVDGYCDEKTKPVLKSVLEPLWQAYNCVEKQRNKRQPLDLDIPERKILLKKDDSFDCVFIPERLEAHKLVEEFMIQANMAAAETLEQKKQVLIYRIHDSPSPAKMESFREFVKTMGVSLNASKSLYPTHFNKILDSAKNSENAEILNQTVLRSQSQAEYSTKNIGHFGLNLPRYAHFTSPIRRYADLIVHRALVGALELGNGAIKSWEKSQLDAIATDISKSEQRATQAQRNTIDRLVANHLSQSIGKRFFGRITGVTRAGLFVTLSETGGNGFVPINSITNEYFIFDLSSHSIVGEKSGLAYQLGQLVEVKLIEVAPVAGAMRFRMLSEGVKLPTVQIKKTGHRRTRPAKAFPYRKKRWNIA